MHPKLPTSFGVKTERSAALGWSTCVHMCVASMNLIEIHIHIRCTAIPLLRRLYASVACSTACSLKTLRLMPRRCLPKEGEAHAACRQLMRRCDIVKIFHSRHACYCMSSVLLPEFSSSNNFLWKKSRLVQCMEEGEQYSFLQQKI